MGFAVGELVRARGRDWMVLPGSHEELLLLRPLGGSDEETTGVLTSLEEVTRAEFPPPDPGRDLGDHRSGRILRDAVRLSIRAAVGPFRSIGRIAVDPRPYQFVPLLMALRLDPVRLLIADDVGIGKTIEALLIATELLEQGDIRRLAVLCPPHLAEQWQREMRDKFHLDAELVLPATIRRLERPLGVGESLFERYPITVVSTDFIKSDRHRHTFLMAAPECIIVDEAHTAVASGPSRARHQRHELMRELAADPGRHLLLLTATPHSGHVEGFRHLLELLDPRFADLPDDLRGEDKRPLREQLARHLVVRTRADITRFLEDTEFPRRLVKEVTYELSPAYAAAFDRCLDIAQTLTRSSDEPDHRVRVRWWSMLALLRALGSSPAAAVATLRLRSGLVDTEDPAEVDELGREAILDRDEVSTEGEDLPPGIDPEDRDDVLRRRLRELLREVEPLGPRDDRKLAVATATIRELIDEGFDPIVFCRFIATAEYVGEHLRSTLGEDVHIEVVTGQLPPEERERRVAELGQQPHPRVLVATDCLSEGVNLQEHFTAVVHYDLAWNPSRHEQRAGRVDRFGQPAPEVRVVTIYGADNHIDQAVLEVLIRKHEQIRRDLGISVPVPGTTDEIVQELMEQALRSRTRQLTLDVGPLQGRIQQWEDAAARERENRSLFAQHRIRPGEIRPLVEEVRASIGDAHTVQRFLTDVLGAYGARVQARDDTALELDLSPLPPEVRDLLSDLPAQVVVRTTLPVRGGERYLPRTHPMVEALATHTLETALDPDARPDGVAVPVAARCGVVRTAAVDRRTVLLVLRLRFHLEPTGDRPPLMAEAAETVAFRGDPTSPDWCPPEEVASLLSARPAANITPEQAQRLLTPVLDGLGGLRPHLDTLAQRAADRLLDAHTRVRSATGRRGAGYRVRPQPPDVVGVYVLVPAGRTEVG